MQKRPMKRSTIIEWTIDGIIICVLAVFTLPRIPGNYQVGAAMAELATVKNGLGMYQAENDSSSYPLASSITNHADLIKTLEVYLGMPDAKHAAWRFLSYSRVNRDSFVLVGRAKDFKLTRVTVTPRAIKTGRSN